MKYIFLALSIILFSFNAKAQTKAEKDKAKFEEKIEEKKAEYIANIVNSLEVDAFQKHILTQRLNSYYDELTKINMLNIQTFEKTALINDLDLRHFKDFEDMLGEEFVTTLLEKVKGKDKSDQKRKKKKRKKRNKDN